MGGELDVGVVFLALLLEDDGALVALGRVQVLFGFVEVDAREVVAVGMAVLLELIGSGFRPQRSQHIRFLLDNLLAIPHEILTVLGLEGLIVLLEILQAAALPEVLLDVELALVDDVDGAEEVVGVLVGFREVEVADEVEVVVSLFGVGVEEGEALVGFLVGPWQFDEENVAVGLVEHPSDVHDHIVPPALLEQHCSDHQQIFRAHLTHLVMDDLELGMRLLQ